MTFPPQVLFEALILPLSIAFVWAVPAMLAGGRGRAILTLGAAAGIVVTFVMILGMPDFMPQTSLGRVIQVPILAVLLAAACGVGGAGERLVILLTAALTACGAAWTVYPQLAIADIPAIVSVLGVAIVGYWTAGRMASMNASPAAAAGIVIGIAFGVLLLTAWGQQTAAAQLSLACLAGAAAVFWIALGAPTIGWSPVAGLALLPAPLSLVAWQVSYGAGPDWAVLPLGFIPVAAAALAMPEGRGGMTGRVQSVLQSFLIMGVVASLAMGAIGWIVLPEAINYR